MSKILHAEFILDNTIDTTKSAQRVQNEVYFVLVHCFGRLVHGGRHAPATFQQQQQQPRSQLQTR